MRTLFRGVLPLLAAVVSLGFAPAACAAQAGSWRPTDGLASEPGRFDDLAFADAQLAFTCSGGGGIYRSRDGARSWERVLLAPDEYFRAVDFLDARRGFCSSLSGALLMTDDGGDTWVDIRDRLPAGTPGMCGLAHAGDTVFAAGIFAAPAVFARSVDRGVTWTVTALDALADGFAEVYFADARTGFLGGTGPRGAVLLRTDDGGDSWREALATDNAIEYVWKVFPVDPVGDLLYASIESFRDETRAARSRDGGATWEVVPVNPRGLDIQGIGFASPDTGWVAPRSDAGLRTVDGGATWDTDSDFPPNVNRVVRSPAGVLFAAGPGVYVYDPSAVVGAGPAPPAGPTMTSRLRVRGGPGTGAPFALSLALGKTTNVRVDVLDSAGRHVAELARGRLPGGEHPLDAAPLEALPPGDYLVALRADDGFSAARLFLVATR